MMNENRMLLLGNVRQQLDITELGGVVTEMQNAFLENQRTDLDQARSIAALRRENEELKLYLATLIRLLVARGALRADEVEAAVRAIEK